jgi:hypothetical protein
MAIAKNGLFGSHTGKVGNLVYYELNGKNVVREIGKTTKPSTEKQLKVQMETDLISSFFSKVLPFIKVGFSVARLGTALNAHNIGMKQPRELIIKGLYPNLELAFDQIILSTGTLTPAVEPEVTAVAEGLRFSWHTDPQMEWSASSDQVMMLAYFPEEKIIAYQLFGSSRLSGTDVLDIPETLQDKYMETYISFVAADRKELANSTYMGNFNL